jgi:hypothetical protein
MTVIHSWQRQTSIFRLLFFEYKERFLHGHCSQRGVKLITSVSIGVFNERDELHSTFSACCFNTVATVLSPLSSCLYHAWLEVISHLYIMWWSYFQRLKTPSSRHEMTRNNLLGIKAKQEEERRCNVSHFTHDIKQSNVFHVALPQCCTRAIVTIPSSIKIDVVSRPPVLLHFFTDGSFQYI